VADELSVVFGRQPVLEALRDPAVVVEEVLLSRRLAMPDVVAAAADRGVAVRRVAPEKVGRVSGNARHDQGVVALVGMSGFAELRESLAALALAPAGPVLVLDGVTNPGNVGMILRTAVAFGVGGVVLPRAGSPDVGPLVVKASAGVALHAPVLRCDTAAEGVALLRAAGFRVLGLAAGASSSIWSMSISMDLDQPERIAVVLGNETSGLSVEVDELVSIPMTGGVDSLNVAVAAGVLCAEFARRRARSGFGGDG
jgi:23S rRNA (guanosine2251-2'-O)-methyltransferase